VLIGRAAELERIHELLAAARAGHSAALVFSGSPGIGKTALLDEAAALAREDGMTVLAARALESESELPFSGLAELLAPVLDLRERLPAAQAAALEGSLALGGEVAPHTRLAIGAALLGLLSLAAEEAPVLCVVDDMQWLDEPSKETLRFAARRLGAEGVAMLGAQRPELSERSAGIPELELTALPEAAALELLQATRREQMPADVVRRLVSTAAGNPMALLEIPELLSREELEGRAPLEGPLPPGETLERVIARRLETLPGITREALAVVAAAEVRAGEIALRALELTGLPAVALEPAEAAGMVTLAPGEVTFRHPLLRAAAYHAAPPVHRRRAHRAVAQALPEDDPQRAWQLAAATSRPDAEAAAALERAGAAARARGGFVSAAHAHLRAAELSPEPLDRARRLVEAARDLQPAGHPDEGLARLEQAERVLALAEGADVAAVATELRTLRAQVGLRVGRVGEAQSLLREQALRMEEAEPVQAAVLRLQSSLAGMALQDHRGWLGDAERALALAGDVELLRGLAALSAGAARLTVPDTAGGRALLAEGEALVDRAGVGAAIALAPELVALAAHGWLWVEEYERGRALLDRLIEAGRAAAAVGALPYPLAARAQAQLRLGRLPEARADADEAVALAEQTGQDPALVIALGSVALVEAWRGEAAACHAAAARAKAVGERRGMPLPAIYAVYAESVLATGLGSDDAVPRAEVMRDTALPGNVIWIPDLVDAYLNAGRADDAAPWVERFERLAPGKRVAPAVAARLRGQLIAAGADAAAAEAQLRAAVALHAGHPAPHEEGRTLLALGETLLSAGRREEAREPLRAAIDRFERAGARPWAERARRGLRAAGAVARTMVETAPGAELTPHEQRIAQLVAQGLTNRETAAALFVSTKTVEHHLRNVFRKLGLRRRAELARAMAEQRAA
jgi:DNA-binding CsgD family transcriptional regulator